MSTLTSIQGMRERGATPLDSETSALPQLDRLDRDYDYGYDQARDGHDKDQRIGLTDESSDKRLHHDQNQNHNRAEGERKRERENEKAGSDIDSHTHEDEGNGPEIIPDIPFRYRAMAFSLIVLFSTGAAFTESTLGPLKSTLVKELKITNTQFSTISTASNLVNTVLPVIGGIGMDYVGGVYAAMAACVFCVIGSVVAATAANTGRMSLLIGGRILMGFGSIVIETSQNKLYAHWFKGSSLATAIAIDLAWNSLTSIMARSAAVPMSLLNGWYGWALWIPACTTGLCTFIVIAYWVFERSIPQEYAPKNGSDVRKRVSLARGKFAIRNITQLPSFFWMMCGTEIFQNAARTVYSVNVADIQSRTRGTSTLAAGYNASLQNVVTIVSVPLLGMFFDRYGWRMPFVSLGAALYVVVFALIGLTQVHPLAPVVLSSFALSLNVLPFVGSIPLLINDESLMGTAYGVWSSFIACNNIILEISTGAIQDATPGQSYERVIYCLIAIKGFQVCLGPIYDYLDGRMLGHTLRLNEKKRLALRAERRAAGTEFIGWKVHKPTTWFFGMQFAAMITVSWVIYLVFTIAPAARK